MHSRKRLTTEEFISRAKEKRTDVAFDYSKVEYINNRTKVLIIDPDYGEFLITPSSFLMGHGHPIRGNTTRATGALTTEEFISRAKEKRTDVDFDYSKVEYINNKTKVLIIDPDFGEFYITPSNFLEGHGHPIRGNMTKAFGKTLTNEEFISRAKEKRTDVDFDYSKTVYINALTKVLVIDPDFGEFTMTPGNFLAGHNHPARGKMYRTCSTEMFIHKAKATRKDYDYNYSQVEYVNSTTKVLIIDPDFGGFMVSPSSFLAGSGHPKRASTNRTCTTEEFIAKAKAVRTELDFGYEKVEYIGNKIKVTIIDPDFGEFKIAPSNFLNGRGHPKRGAMKRTSTLEGFITKAKSIWKDVDYDYNKVEYVNSYTKVLIIDPDFGEFLITPNHFISGRGHPQRKFK